MGGNCTFQIGNFDAFLFDIDGTLLNSRDWIHYNAFHTALKGVWECIQKIDDVPVHGNTDPGILRAACRRCGIDDQRFYAGLPEARILMCEEVEKHAAELRPELCDGVVELLTTLRAAGKLLGVCTGNLERIGWAKLSAAGLRHLIATGSFSDTHEIRRDIFQEGLDKMRTLAGAGARICFAGDTPNDVTAAHELGIPVIAVATGVYSVDQLREHGPTHCVGCCRELL